MPARWNSPQAAAVTSAASISTACAADVLDPWRHPEGRPPLRHQADGLAGDAADRAEHVGTRVDDHLASHLRREHLAGEQGGIDILAIEVAD